MLDHSNWEKHLLGGKHREVVAYHDSFPLVLQDPDIVVEAWRDGHLHFYRRRIVDDRYPGRYLRLIIVTLGDIHKVTTWWIDREVDLRGAIRYERRRS